MPTWVRAFALHCILACQSLVMMFFIAPLAGCFALWGGVPRVHLHLLFVWWCIDTGFYGGICYAWCFQAVTFVVMYALLHFGVHFRMRVCRCLSIACMVFVASWYSMMKAGWVAFAIITGSMHPLFPDLQDGLVHEDVFIRDGFVFGQQHVIGEDREDGSEAVFIRASFDDVAFPVRYWREWDARIDLRGFDRHYNRVLYLTHVGPRYGHFPEGYLRGMLDVCLRLRRECRAQDREAYFEPHIPQGGCVCRHGELVISFAAYLCHPSKLNLMNWYLCLKWNPLLAFHLYGYLECPRLSAHHLYGNHLQDALRLDGSRVSVSEGARVFFLVDKPVYMFCGRGAGCRWLGQCQYYHDGVTLVDARYTALVSAYKAQWERFYVMFLGVADIGRYGPGDESNFVRIAGYGPDAHA